MALTQFGKEVRKLRIDPEIKTKDMAEALDVSPAYISAVETGKKRLTDDFISKVIDFFLKNGINAKDDLTRAAELSKDEFRINVQDENDESRALVAAFARKFQGLSSEQKRNLEKILK